MKRIVIVFLFVLVIGPFGAADENGVPDVPYLSTPEEVVEAMLKIAGVRKEDVVYDLGCGDGRIVIMAAEKFGARGVGIDIDPDRIREARRNAEIAGVQDRVRFVQEDFFQSDLSGATVITLYLLPEVNLRLRPRLLQLPPGTRIVSHAYDMSDWEPLLTRQVSGRWIYFWKVPTRAESIRLGLLP